MFLLDVSFVEDNYEKVYFYLMINEVIISMKFEDFMKFVKVIGYELIIVYF